MSSQLIIGCVYLMVILLYIETTDAGPTSLYNWNGIQTNECLINDSVKEKCQMCAKVTKSNIVYPMCCKSLEESREWCERYLRYGLKEQEEEEEEE